MAFIQATVTLENLTGFSEDSIVNTFAINTAPGWSPITDIGEVTFPLVRFYNHVQNSGSRLSTFIAESISRGALDSVIRLYDVTAALDGSPHGSPVAVDFFTLLENEASFGLPSEVALVLTTRAEGALEAPVEAPDSGDPGTAVDRPRQRLSGRVFVGPFTVSSANHTDALRSRPVPILRTTLLDAAEDLKDQLGNSGHLWSVWSRANEQMVEISSVSIDDAWDTMRKRGVPPTTRTSRTLGLVP